jgi:Neuraminidase (sialidase)
VVHQPKDDTDGEYQSLTGDKVGSDYFQHNNMVPYFGSKSHTLVLDENTAESIIR